MSKLAMVHRSVGERGCVDAALLAELREDAELRLWGGRKALDAIPPEVRADYVFCAVLIASGGGREIRCEDVLSGSQEPPRARAVDNVTGWLEPIVEPI